jgi:type IV pilus assembly protein PilX
MRTAQESLKLTKFADGPSQRQQGATLIIALVMLLLISLLAIGGMQGSVLQERMSSNAHDSAISFQAAEAALRQAEADLTGALATRLAADDIDPLATPSDWDGANPASAGTGDAGGNVSGQPVYHHAYLASVGAASGVETGVGGVFERFEVTSRGQGGTDEAITVLQSTVLLPPE